MKILATKGDFKMSRSCAQLTSMQQLGLSTLKGETGIQFRYSFSQALKCVTMLSYPLLHRYMITNLDSLEKIGLKIRHSEGKKASLRQIVTCQAAVRGFLTRKPLYAYRLARHDLLERQLQNAKQKLESAKKKLFGISPKV